MQRFSVCTSLRQSRFVHARLVSLEIRLCLIVVVFACRIFPMLFVLTWTINIITCFFADGDVLGKCSRGL